MTYYYKRIDSEGNVISLITCDQHLEESAEQIEITEEEYIELYAALPQPEPSEPEEDELADAIAALELLGVTPEEGETNG